MSWGVEICGALVLQWAWDVWRFGIGDPLLAVWLAGAWRLPLPGAIALSVVLGSTHALLHLAPQGAMTIRLVLLALLLQRLRNVWHRWPPPMEWGVSVGVLAALWYSQTGTPAVAPPLLSIAVTSALGVAIHHLRRIALPATRTGAL